MSREVHLQSLSSIGKLATNPLWRVMFDEAWYLDRYPDVVRKLETHDYIGALDHFLEIGALEGRIGSPFFDADWYLSVYRSLAGGSDQTRYLDAITHYLTAGVAEHNNPNFLFDEVWYTREYGIAASLAAGEYVNAYHHFLVEGAAKTYSPSPLFQEEWYRHEYPDVGAAIGSGMLPSGYHDYIRRGPENERNPCPYFDVAWYRAKYGLPDNGKLSYLDYLTSGAALGRDPGPHFEEVWYRASNSGAGHAIRSGNQASAFHHYLYEGARLNWAPNPYFQPNWYQSWYSHVQDALDRQEYAHPFEHYLITGINEGLSPNPYFDELWYLDHNPDVEQAVESKLISSGHQHFLEHGECEGRVASLLFDGEWYLKQYADVREYIQNGLVSGPYDHFCRYGLGAKRNVSADFDEPWYLYEHPEVQEEVIAGQWLSGLHHFIAEGIVLGYSPNPRAEGLLKSHITTDECPRRELRYFLEGDGILECRNSDTPLVSIVLISFNRAELTLRCLRSIANWAEVPYEVIVVDNNSQDSTIEMLQRVRGPCVLRNERNVHFLRAANQAAQRAVGKYLLFLNNDSELQVGALGSAAEILDREPDVGVVGGKIILRSGILQEAGSYLKKNGFSVQFGRGQLPFQCEYMHRRDVPYVSGAFLMTPRKLFGEMGGFDLAYIPAYCEDADYCLRLWKRGLRTVFDPDSIILHHEGASSPYRRFLFPAVVRNVATLRRRHKDYFATVPDYSIGPVSTSDGSQMKKAYLVVVEAIPESPESDMPYRPKIIRQMLDEGLSLTLYPLKPWFGDRKEIASIVPSVLEVVTGKGAEELVEFCRQRAPMFDGIILWTDEPEVLPRIKSLRKYLPDLRIFSSSPEVAGPGVYD
jgi:GT2 family glycosyltransferase